MVDKLTILKGLLDKIRPDRFAILPIIESFSVTIFDIIWISQVGTRAKKLRSIVGSERSTRRRIWRVLPAHGTIDSVAWFGKVEMSFSVVRHNLEIARVHCK